MADTTVILKEHKWANGEGSDYTFNSISFGIAGPSGLNAHEVLTLMIRQEATKICKDLIAQNNSKLHINFN